MDHFFSPIEPHFQPEPLFEYQLGGVSFLHQRKAGYLAFEMGLGKTATAIRTQDMMLAKSIVITCPAVARVNWAREIERFAFRRGQKWTIASYSELDKIPKDPFDFAIIDEAHYLKSSDAARTRSILGKNGLLHRVSRVAFLSGTPTPNHAGELWPILYACGVTALSYENFVLRFCTSKLARWGNAVQVQITGTRTENIPDLKKIIAPFMLVKKKEDGMLPKLTFDKITVQAGEVDLDTDSCFIKYVFPEDDRAKLWADLDKQKAFLSHLLASPGVNGNSSSALAECANSVSTLRRYTGMQKVDAVSDMIEDELTSGAYAKVVIFAIHQGVIENLRKKLAKFNPLTLYGGTPADKRQRNIDKFQRYDKFRIFIGNIHAAGTAISLTAADNIVFIESDWVPGNNAQAVMRCHRIGQTRPVYVRFVALAGSLDEQIQRILKRKTEEISQIYDDMPPPDAVSYDPR